jgi:hypothetical protein
VVILFSCKGKEEITTNISTTLQDGSWKITYFIDSTENETNHFTGYGFQFGSDQTVNAAKDSVTISGEWHTGDDDDLTNLIIEFEDIPDFKDLNADWDAYELTDTLIKLRDFDNLGNDYLTFQKNQ